MERGAEKGYTGWWTCQIDIFWGNKMGVIKSHRDLIVYKKSFAAASEVFQISKRFPREEMYSLTDQVRRASRSVAANLAEAWRKRRYEKHFLSTLNIAEAEAAETQAWIEFSVAHEYISDEVGAELNEKYEEILRMLVAMTNHPEKWVLNISED